MSSIRLFAVVLALIGWVDAAVGQAVFPGHQAGWMTPVPADPQAPVVFFLPFCEAWPGQSCVSYRWSVVQGVSVRTEAQNEPSPPYSLQFNLVDEIWSKPILLGLG